MNTNFKHTNSEAMKPKLKKPKTKKETQITNSYQFLVAQTHLLQLSTVSVLQFFT
jgi:hypothetical protein